MERIRVLAHKVLDHRDHPEAGNVLVSLEDPDARFGHHCGTYCGYLVDLTMDADSELITAVTVPVSTGDEADDAAVLIRQEEEAHGNDVEALSADAAQFKGAPLRELTDPQGLNLEVFVPPVAEPQMEYFTSEDFPLDEAGEKVTCPAGQQTSRRNPSKNDTGWIYRFPRTVCARCALQGTCMEKLPNRTGRSVVKNAYAAQYAAARAKATTLEYAAVRREHRKVERKLNEMVRHHRSRRGAVPRASQSADATTDDRHRGEREANRAVALRGPGARDGIEPSQMPSTVPCEPNPGHKTHPSIRQG